MPTPFTRHLHYGRGGRVVGKTYTVLPSIERRPGDGWARCATFGMLPKHRKSQYQHSSDSTRIWPALVLNALSRPLRLSIAISCIGDAKSCSIRKLSRRELDQMNLASGDTEKSGDGGVSWNSADFSGHVRCATVLLPRIAEELQRVTRSVKSRLQRQSHHSACIYRGGSTVGPG